MAIRAIAAGIIFSIGKGVSIAMSIQTQNETSQSDMVAQRRREIELATWGPKNLKFEPKPEMQAECTIMGHEFRFDNDFCSFCGLDKI